MEKTERKDKHRENVILVLKYNIAADNKGQKAQK